MRSEKEIPIENHCLMILGKLSNALIRQIEEGIPQWMERMQGKMGPSALAAKDRFNSRDKADDRAFYTLYAYADIPLGRRYDCLFRKDGRPESVSVDCTIEHIIFESWFPVGKLEKGHKHVVFLSFDSAIPECIPTFECWEDVGQNDWLYGLCDQATYNARQARGE